MIKINKENEGPFVAAFKDIYQIFSQQPFPTKLYNVPLLLEMYIENVYRKLNLNLPIFCNTSKKEEEALFSFPTLKQYNFKTNKKIIIGFSGGKDSVAAAILAKQSGYNPILYHLYGINRTYKFERVNAKKIAKELQMPYVEEYIEIKGKQEFPDHVFKNQIILCSMLDFGVTEKVNSYLLGNHLFENCKDANVQFEFSDSLEQINLFDKWVTSYLLNYKRETILKNNMHAVDIILKYDKNLINLYSSCITPLYRKPMMRKYIHKKFGDVLLEGRCGYCYKCTKEYIHLVDSGVLPKNKPFYLHCKNRIQLNSLHYE